MCEMTIETVKSTIKGHLGELLNLDPAQIGDNDLLIDDLGADSIVIVQLYLSCQEDFGILVSEELDLYISQSVQSLSEVVMQKISEEAEQYMFIELKNASKVYGLGESAVNALDGAELSAEEGEVSEVLGPSGSGKTTLLNIIGGLDTLDSGSLTVGGRTVSGLKQKELTEYRREDVGFIFQFYNLIPDLTARENVEVVADIAPSPMNLDELFGALDINGLQDRFPRELSGGQQQRVAIARAMVKNPKLLLCDELTGALDTKSSLGVLQAVQTLNDRYHTTVVIITHNAAISGMADRIIQIKDGKIQSNEVNANKVSPMELVL